MYETFFGFRTKPFALVPDPEFLFLTEKHRTALTCLEYAFAEQVGPVLLTGEVGAGKTTLLQYLMGKTTPGTDAVLLSNPRLTPEQLFRQVLRELGETPAAGTEKADLLDQLKRLLRRLQREGRRAQLIVDEAQSAGNEILEELRLLANVQEGRKLLLQIVLVGSPDLRARLMHPEMSQLTQRVAVNYHLGTMTQADTRGYIAHRLETAGGRTDLFDSQAVTAIHTIAKGVPRTVNLICDATLVYAYADELATIRADVVHQVVADQYGFLLTEDESGDTPEPSRKDPSANGSGTLKQQVGTLEKRMAIMEKNLAVLAQRLKNGGGNRHDALIKDLKDALEIERRRNQKILVAYGQMQQKYQALLRRAGK